MGRGVHSVPPAVYPAGSRAYVLVAGPAWPHAPHFSWFPDMGCGGVGLVVSGYPSWSPPPAMALLWDSSERGGHPKKRLGQTMPGLANQARPEAREGSVASLDQRPRVKRALFGVCASVWERLNRILRTCDTMAWPQVVPRRDTHPGTVMST